MRALLRFSLLLAAVGLLLISPARASHILGGQLSYRWVSGNNYELTLSFYRDCTGIALPTTVAVSATSSTACNGGTAVTATLQPLGSPVLGNFYCPQVQPQATCNNPSSLYANYETQTYRGIIALAPATDWTLSYEECCRPSIANLTMANSQNFRFEATLNNRIAAGGSLQTITNTSPVFSLSPAYTVPWNRSTTFSNATFDADGDSLAYSLDVPLTGCNTPAAYEPVVRSVGTFQPGGIYTVAPGSPTTYSSIYPIVTAYDTTGVFPNITLTPKPFVFNPATGSITLTPGRLVNSPSVNGDNKYVVVVKVTEYRRLPGSNRRYRVGSVRRDLLLTVYDCGPNALPRIAPNVTVQSGSHSTAQALGQEIAVVAGEPISVVVTATDANASQVLTMNMDYNATPGTSIQNLGGGQARVTFTPPLSLPNGLYRVAVTAADDACPIRGLDSQVLTFRVTASSPLATRARVALAIEAFPNPFTDQVQFKLATAGVQLLSVCDQLGRTVATIRSQADGTVRWQPAATLPTGLYLARTADGSQTVRLLRNAPQ